MKTPVTRKMITKLNGKKVKWISQTQKGERAPYREEVRISFTDGTVLKIQASDYIDTIICQN